MEEISIVYGDTRTFHMALVDEDGEPAELSALVFTAKQRPYDEDYVFQKSTEDSGAEFTIGPDVGDADITITGDDLEGIANHWHTLVWDCRHVDPTDVPITPLRGVLRVTPSMLGALGSS